jgi:hypothetical protein
MAIKRAVRKRAPSSTNLDARVAKKGRNEKPAAESGGEKESSRSNSPDIGESDSDGDSSFEADKEDSSSSDGEESTASSYHSKPLPSSRRSNGNATSGSHAATPQKRSRGSTGAPPDRDGSRKKQAAGLEVRFKKPQARKAGSTPYLDETIHPNTFLFLGDLAAHNERDWLKCEPPSHPFPFSTLPL